MVIRIQVKGTYEYVEIKTIDELFFYLMNIK